MTSFQIHEDIENRLNNVGENKKCMAAGNRVSNVGANKLKERRSLESRRVLGHLTNNNVQPNWDKWNTKASSVSKSSF